MPLSVRLTEAVVFSDIINDIMQKLFPNKLLQKLFQKISQQMATLSRKLKWTTFYGTRCRECVKNELYFSENV